MGEEVNQGQAQRPKRKTPTGFVATCQCGKTVGAMDYTRTDRAEAGKLLGQWLTLGCTVMPRFTGTWSAHMERCECGETPNAELTGACTAAPTRADASWRPVE